MAVSSDQALAELKARGVDPNNPPPEPDASSIDASDAMEELKRRGIQIPTDKPSSLPSYASPEQQKEYPISSKIAKGLGVGSEVLASPFQAFGEPIRQAVSAAQGQDPGPYRAPTIVQRIASMFPKAPEALQTKEQAPDMISALVNPAMAGYRGIAATAQNAPQGVQPALQAGVDAANQPPGLPEAALSTAAAIGSGEAGNVPFTAAVKPLAAIAKLLETGEVGGIPGSGMAIKQAAELHPVPFGLENLTAPAKPDILALQKSTDPAVAKAANLMTAGGLTGSPTLNTIEGFGKKIPFASNIFQERFAKIYDALKNIKEPIVEASKPPADLGLDVQQGLSNASNAEMAKAKALYANAENAIPPGSQIPTNNLQEVASNLLKSQAKLPPGAEASGASPLLRSLAGSGYEGKDVGQIMPDGGRVKGQAVPAYDYPTLQSLRSELNTRIAAANQALGGASPNAKFQSSPEIGIYSKLKDAVDKDLNAFSDQTGGAFKSAYSEANKTYQAYKGIYSNDKFVQSILNEQNPENVVNKVISAAKNNPRALGQLKLSLPTKTLNDLQTYFIKDMTEKDPNVFSPSHFVRQYDSIGEKQLTNILGPEKMAEIRPLYTLSKAGVNSESAANVGTGPSGAGVASGAFIRNILTGVVGGMALGHPVKGALAGGALLGAEMEGLPMMAKGYLSGPATRILSRQADVIPHVPEAISQGAPIAGKTAIPIKDLIEQLKQKFNQNRKP